MKTAVITILTLVSLGLGMENLYYHHQVQRNQEQISWLTNQVYNIKEELE